MPQISFPGGQVVNVEFDETQHSYVVAHKLSDGSFSDFRPTHGVTTPLDVVPKPFLKKWAAKVCTKTTLEFVMNNPGVVDKLPAFFEALDAYENNIRDENGKPVCSYYRLNKNYPFYKELKAAPDRASTVGKELGTWLHESIEHYYNSERETLPIITPDVKGMWDSFVQFDNFWKPKPETLEFFVYSLMFGYSGQGDFRGWVNGKYVILDWKSTNRSEWNKDGISVDYFFQLGGLAQAEFERTGKWAADLGAVNLDKKGDEPRVIFASEFGMSPQDCARGYVSCFNTHHTIKNADYKFVKR
jgi:hypothetical protein